MMPTYDPARDGNRFEWILTAAAAVRAERVAERAVMAAARPILNSAARLDAGSSPTQQAESIGQRKPELRVVSAG